MDVCKRLSSDGYTKQEIERREGRKRQRESERAIERGKTKTESESQTH